MMGKVRSLSFRFALLLLTILLCFENAEPQTKRTKRKISKMGQEEITGQNFSENIQSMPAKAESENVNENIPKSTLRSWLEHDLMWSRNKVEEKMGDSQTANDFYTSESNNLEGIDKSDNDPQTSPTQLWIDHSFSWSDLESEKRFDFNSSDFETDAKSSINETESNNKNYNNKTELETTQRDEELKMDHEMYGAYKNKVKREYSWSLKERAGSGVRVGSGNTRGNTSTGVRGSGVKIGGSPRGRSTPPPLIPPSAPPNFYSTYTEQPPTKEDHSQQSSKELRIGLVVPYKSFGTRDYLKAVSLAINGLQRKLNLFKRYELKVSYDMKELTPSPMVCVTIISCEREPEAWRSPGHSKSSSTTLNIGLIVPKTNFGVREYIRAVNTAVGSLHRGRGMKLNFLKQYGFTPKNVNFVMFSLTPSPTAILNSLCKEFLSVNVSAILYLMNYESYGRSTASAQYFLQLAGYLGIPVIAWNADNSGLERRASQSTLQLQLAPSIEHQTAAMLSILERYKWHQFSVVTSQIAGHDDFIQAVRERVTEMQDRFKFTILNAVLVTKQSDLLELVNSESRVILLYATRDEAATILQQARDLQITGENYVWVVTQSVIENLQTPSQFPVGMLGVHFDTSSSSLVNEITTAIKVYAYGVEEYVSDPKNANRPLGTQLSCEGPGDARWPTGDRFFKYLRNVSVEGDQGKPNVEFTADGDLKAAELKIMNLRPGVSKQLVWEEIGVWKSWQKEGLDIKDIVWPGNSHTPPQGVPEKFHLRITFLEEPPYINLAPPDPVSGKCSMDRGVLCRMANEHDMAEVDVHAAHKNGSFFNCCSGFCIDLLEKFAEELGFTYELVRVEDGRWGTLVNGKWNGLIADLVNRKTDMVMTSLMINSEREAVVDFSVPFMETGIAIVVAKRTGIISPTAFLEPFDTASWMLVGVVAIQAATFMIFLFEWLSPSGFDMKLALRTDQPNTPHRFSLFRTYWLVWAVLFQAAVHVDSPRGFTARFMTNVWAMFAVVFLAIYTANLAAFMITREEFHEFSGLDDYRLSRPFSHKPMFKFGTIPWSHTDSTLARYFREMHTYMSKFNKTSVSDGVGAVLTGDLDAFIYDGTVLDYLVSQDEDCRLLTVGSWYAMTGYGLAFSRNSKYVQMFNKRLLDLRANGDLERLRRYWMTGTCKPGKQEHKSSDPLALEQFLSAFLLLMAGILLAALLLLMEHMYFKYLRKHLAKTDQGGCCALISLSMGKSLTFRGAVFEATDIMRQHRCHDPLCDTRLWKTRHELELARLRIRQLLKEMEAHGVRPPQRRLASASDLLRAGTRDMTRSQLLSPDFIGGSARDIYRPDRTEIAEMETVL